MLLNRRPMNPGSPTRRHGMTGKAQKAVTAVVATTITLFATGGMAQGSPATPAPEGQETQMQQFVFLFRQGATDLSEADRKRQNDEARAWALQQLDAGRELDPHMIDEERHVVTPDGETGAAALGGEAPVVAILFVQARDFDEAVELAKTHPGPRHGASIEVRPWHAPPARAATPSQE